MSAVEAWALAVGCGLLAGLVTFVAATLAQR